MTDRFSDPAWWPRPRPRPQQPLGPQLLWLLVPVLAIGGAVVALTLAFAPHHGRTPSPRTHTCAQAGCGAAPAPDAAARARVQTAREELQSCMSQAGGNAGGPRGFGRGPSSRLREAFDVCRSMLRQGGRQQPPPQPAPTASGSLPVA